MWMSRTVSTRRPTTRKVMLFPGSGCTSGQRRKKSPRQPRATDRGAAAASRRRAGFMAAEIVETTRLLRARWPGSIPRGRSTWARHLLQGQPHRAILECRRGRVLVKRRARLYGLELESRAVGYGKIDPGARDRAVHPGRMGERRHHLAVRFPRPQPQVRDKVEIVLPRTRSSGY